MTIPEQLDDVRRTVAAHKALSVPAVTAAARAAYEPIKVEGTEQEAMLAHSMFIAGCRYALECTKEKMKDSASTLSEPRTEQKGYMAERDKIAWQPCRCVSCPDCQGTGRTWYRTGGYPEEDVETCSYCEGSGITEQCDRCADLTELERDYELMASVSGSDNAMSK